MTDVIIVIEEEAPSVVITTTEQTPNIEIPSNSNTASLGEEEAPSVVITTIEQTPNIKIPSNSTTASLGDLNDVSVPAPQEGQVLTFKTGLWRAEDVVDSSIKTPLDGGEFF